MLRQKLIINIWLLHLVGLLCLHTLLFMSSCRTATAEMRTHSSTFSRKDRKLSYKPTRCTEQKALSTADTVYCCINIVARDRQNGCSCIWPRRLARIISKLLNIQDPKDMPTGQKEMSRRTDGTTAPDFTKDGRGEINIKWRALGLTLKVRAVNKNTAYHNANKFCTLRNLPQNKKRPFR